MPFVGEYLRGDSPTQTIIPRLTRETSTPVAVPEESRGVSAMPQTLQVYLDGQLVDVAMITPARHLYVGLFRLPTPGLPHGHGPRCACGILMQYLDEEFIHWQAGHWDVPQYRSLSSQEGVA